MPYAPGIIECFRTKNIGLTMKQEAQKNNTVHRFQPAGGRVLTQSVLKHIPRRKGGVWEGAAIGFDAAVFQNGEITEAQAIGAEPTSRFPEAYPLSAGEAAWITAENQLATQGIFAALDPGTTARSRGTVTTAQILLVAGMSCPESRIRREMQRLTQLSLKRECPIVGGNTVYFGDGEDCLVQVLLTGRLNDAPGRGINAGEPHLIPRKMQPGDRVYFLGEVGCLGADILARTGREALRKRFSDSYIDTMEYEPSDFSVNLLASMALEAGAVFLHDVSNGGVHAALYQMAEAIGCGIRVRHEGLTIRQSVIELCEELNINPYQLLGTGGLLAAVPEDGIEAFESRIPDVIPCGELTKEKARVVTAESFHMERYLNLPDKDALDIALSFRYDSL